MKNKFEITIQRRMTIVLLFFFIALCSLVGRLFLLQVVYHKDYVALAARQHRSAKELLPIRGTIFAHDKNNNQIPLALNRTFKVLAVSPKSVANPGAAATFLHEKFALDLDEVLRKLSKEDDPYEVLLRKINPSDAERMTAELPPGIFFEDEKLREYPHGTVAAQLLGFVSRESDQEKGRYGLERYYEKELAGEKKVSEEEKNPTGFLMALGGLIIHPPRNGAHLLLTLDYNIQLKSEEVLRRVKEKWQARSAAVLVLDPKTGQILAMDALPDFNPNEFAKEKDFSVFLNPLVESTYEPGSVLKPITMAAGLEEKLIEPDSTYVDPGEIKIGGYKIKNFDGKSYGTQTMTQVLEKSLNTGAVYVARLLGKEKHIVYLSRFGFGEKTDIDLPGEVRGDLAHLGAKRDIDFATASFGQGVAVTPMQLAAAVAAIANGGMLVKPYVVEKIFDDAGNESVRGLPEMRRIVSRETAERLTGMLIAAVRNGFENRAGVKGYFVAGKTGTAQIPNRHGRGYSDQVIHTFVGYAPAFHPKFLILLQLNEPKGNRFAANTVTPAFHDLAEFILNYYEIPPDESREK